MRIWLLQPIAPWTPWYDKVFGFVVRAADDTQARLLASARAGDEGSAAWCDQNQTTCIELTQYGEAGVILRDLAGA